MYICDKCGTKINQDAKFCPQCGDPVTEADKATTIKHKATIPQAVIVFGKSTSVNYQKAVSICKNLPSYEVTGEGKHTVHKVSIELTDIELIVNLFDLVGSWKTSQMLIDGEPATKKDLSYYGLGCYRNRQQSFHPEKYCYDLDGYRANIWGCHYLNMPVEEFSSGWSEMGRFNADGEWIFDKQRIKTALMQAIKSAQPCPALDPERVMTMLSNLPSTVNPRTDPLWSYKRNYQYDEDGNEIVSGVILNLDRAKEFIIQASKPIVRAKQQYTDKTEQSNRYTILKSEQEYPEQIPAISTNFIDITTKSNTHTKKQSTSIFKKILKAIVFLAVGFFVLFIALVVIAMLTN